MITYRAMTPQDIPAGLALCRLVGWNQLARDWELFLQMNSKGCRVGVDESGNVIGTVTTLPYQNRFTWIGMVLVNPSHRRQGIGTHLLSEALQLSAMQETVKLDATPAGREVYLKLGFVDEYEIVRMRGDAIKTGEVRSAASPATTEDFPALFQLDGQVFGADRRALLQSNFANMEPHAFVVKKHKRINGFCLGRPGHNFDQVGPIVAEDVAIAKELLFSALKHRTNDKPIVLDVLTHTPEWLDFVSALGFTPVRPLIRMYRGSNQYPGIPQKQFAILGPEFG
jgi:GNAT superfamily N-acetyltransferase